MRKHHVLHSLYFDDNRTVRRQSTSSMDGREISREIFVDFYLTKKTTTTDGLPMQKFEFHWLDHEHVESANDEISIRICT